MINKRLSNRRSDHGATGNVTNSPKVHAYNTMHGFLSDSRLKHNLVKGSIEGKIAVHSDPAESQHYFESYVKCRLRDSRLSLILKDWITINDGAPFARQQAREYYEKIKAEIAARGPQNK